MKLLQAFGFVFVITMCSLVPSSQAKTNGDGAPAKNTSKDDHDPMGGMAGMDGMGGMGGIGLENLPGMDGMNMSMNSMQNVTKSNSGNWTVRTSQKNASSIWTSAPLTTVKANASTSAPTSASTLNSSATTASPSGSAVNSTTPTVNSTNSSKAIPSKSDSTLAAHPTMLVATASLVVMLFSLQ